MKTKIIIFFLLSLVWTPSFSSNTAGGGVTYRHLGNKKFEITVKVYRDCRGIPFNSINLVLMCVGGSSKTLSPTRISIQDITPTCKSVGKMCNPPNSTNTSSNPAIEEHTYSDTIDFGGSESAYYSCGTLKLAYGQCCRSGAITTGGSGNDFWVTSTMELGISNTNSSPVFNFPAPMIAFCGQPFNWSFSATDSIDHDSLSYSFTDPLTNSTGGKTSWSGSFSAQSPFTPYWPSGYNKSLGPNPNATPPIGIYLDPETGLLIASATDCSETTIMAVSVKEWRKNSSGKYEQIGEIVRDIQFIVMTGAGNNPPTLSGSRSYSICEGEPFNLNIQSSDKVFVPPPPGKAVQNDTVILSWLNPIKNATMALDSSYIKQQAVDFSWTPKTSDVRTRPYMFTVVAKDNACNLTSVLYKTYKLYVYPKIKVSNTLSKISNSDYGFQMNISNKTYQYFVTNNVKTNLPYDNRAYYFKSTNSLISDLEKDTIVFKKNGQFILNHFFVSSIPCNITTVSDTINVSGVFEVNVTRELDTFVCKNTSTRIPARTINAKRPVTYTWLTKNVGVTDTLGYLDLVISENDTVTLEVKDDLGKTNSTYFYVGIKDLPKVSAGTDKITCKGITETVLAKSLKPDTLTWSWSFGGNILSIIDTVKIVQPGNYIVKATNPRGCVSYDTMKLVNYVTKQVALISSAHCQDKNELIQSEIFPPNSNPNSFTQLQWSLQKTLKDLNGKNNALGDLLFDMDPTPKYDYKIRFDKIRINLGLISTDSLKFGLIAWDSNGCQSKAAMTVILTKIPEMDFGFHTFSICNNDSMDLSTKLLTEGTLKWTTHNKPGFSSWPNGSGVIPKGFIKDMKFSKDGGKYFVKVTANFDQCLSSDSVEIVVYPLPIPIISYEYKGDSVKFTDNSLHTISRRWYLNNLNMGKDKTVGFTRSEANEKPIRLELNNTNCGRDTSFIKNTLSIKNPDNGLVKIYPNPATRLLTIEQLKPVYHGTYEIYELTGKLVLDGNLDHRETMVNIENLANGPYYLRIKNATMTSSFRFFKNE